jgi:peptide/nickel transport system permease protein
VGKSRRVITGVVRRLATVGVTLFVGTLAIYGALYLTPGSPIDVLAPRATPAHKLLLVHQYHLNESFINQYLHWVERLLHGDFGQSIIYQEPVTQVLSARVGVTAELVVLSGLLVVVVGFTLGLVGSIWERKVGSAVTIFTAVCVAVPTYVAGTILIAMFAVELRWFPVFGEGSGAWGGMYHLILPAIALALSQLAYVGQLTRVAASTELHSDHVQTAVARGLSGRVRIRRHVIRNAMIPMSTAGGLAVASLIANTVVVEVLFSLSGLGSLLVASIEDKDFVVVQAIAVIILVTFVVLTQVIDLTHPLLDPRVRKG